MSLRHRKLRFLGEFQGTPPAGGAGHLRTENLILAGSRGEAAFGGVCGRPQSLNRGVFL